MAIDGFRQVGQEAGDAVARRRRRAAASADAAARHLPPKLRERLSRSLPPALVPEDERVGRSSSWRSRFSAKLSRAPGNQRGPSARIGRRHALERRRPPRPTARGPAARPRRRRRIATPRARSVGAGDGPGVERGIVGDRRIRVADPADECGHVRARYPLGVRCPDRAVPSTYHGYGNYGQHSPCISVAVASARRRIELRVLRVEPATCGSSGPRSAAPAWPP